MLRTEYIDVSFNLKLQKDLQEDEVICSHCGGTGLQVDDHPFGIKGENSKVHFPHKQQTITGCRHCYNGVQTKCLYCETILNRQTYQCNCEKSKYERDQIQYEKELEKWNKAEKISLSQAIEKYEMVYIDNSDDFVNSDELLEWLEEREEENLQPISRNYLRIYGTYTMDLSMDASSLLEDVCSDLHEDAMDNISDADQKELQTLLDKWCENNKQGTTTYYADYSVGVIL
ncbi:MAG: hypothetical protein PHX04_05925 [Bacilli bacterium]|nr:hypothetical protein [Bacilli bacterium]